MSTILVTYHTFTGKTKQLAEAAAEGARSAGAKVVIKEVVSTDLQDLLGANAVLVATPQTFGAMAGETKKLFERLWPDRSKLAAGTPFALIVCHASGPEATIDFAKRFAQHFGFTQVAETLTVPAAQVEAGISRCQELGAALARAV